MTPDSGVKNATATNFRFFTKEEGQLELNSTFTVAFRFSNSRFQEIPSSFTVCVLSKAQAISEYCKSGTVASPYACYPKLRHCLNIVRGYIRLTAVTIDRNFGPTNIYVFDQCQSASRPIFPE
ncbi:hypothetical protein J6590_099401 [Homalodisca vitripennis]|nr:hypothetical protein J6590_099401 [Homalodisca vitripennis]